MTILGDASGSGFDESVLTFSSYFPRHSSTSGAANLIQYAIHNKKDNPHVHFASNFRPVKDGRFLESKYRFKRADIKEIRKQIADITNNYAFERGYDFSIDHRSYIEQGIYIEPTKHVGWYSSKLLDNSRIILENRFYLF